MGLREKRLGSDMQAVARLCGPESPIQLVARNGEPADRYQLRYEVPGLVVQDGAVVPKSSHLVEVYLTLGYPRQAPQCRMLTPVFHPNIAPHAICVGDHWSGGESLAALLVRIGEMICFQSYNVKSPLNGDAARWAEEHARELPLLKTDLSRLLADGRPAAPEAPPAVDPFDSARKSVPPSMAPAPVRPVAGAVSGHADDVGEERPPGNDRDVPAVSGEVSCSGCGSSLALAPGWDQAWARCPVCGRMVRLAR